MSAKKAYWYHLPIENCQKWSQQWVPKRTPKQMRSRFAIFGNFPFFGLFLDTLDKQETANRTIVFLGHILRRFRLLNKESLLI